MKKRWQPKSLWPKCPHCGLHARGPVCVSKDGCKKNIISFEVKSTSEMKNKSDGGTTEPVMNCSYPNCQCVAKAEENAGGPVKNFECLVKEQDTDTLKSESKPSPVIGETAEGILRDRLIAFTDWYDKLSPAGKVSFWSKDGSAKGLFNMDSEQLVDKFLSIKLKA